MPASWSDTRIPTGFPDLDAALGGGLPRGRIVELVGPQAGGKTTLTLSAIREAQKQGGVAALVDCARDDEDLLVRAKAAGVDVERLLVSQPETTAQALDVTLPLVVSGAVELIVVDRAELLVSESGTRASQALRSLAAAAYRSRATLLFVTRVRRGPPSVSEWEGFSPAIKFYASVRLDVRPTPVRELSRARVVKNKCGPLFRVATFPTRLPAGEAMTP